jgi:hypothetical protein
VTGSLSVLIEDDLVDAYLYGGLLLAWDWRGQLLLIDTEAIATKAAESSGSKRSTARAAFVDNKLLDSSDTRASVRDSPLAKVRNGDGSVVHLSLDDLDPRRFDIGANSAVLDLMASYGRLFVSTDDGLLSLPFSTTEVGPTRKLLRFRCLSTTPRWGTVAASCGQKGAWALLDELVRDGRRRTDQFDEGSSLRHAWLGSALLSFGESEVDVFSAVLAKHEDERRHVEGFISADDDAIAWWTHTSADGLGNGEYVGAVKGLLLTGRDGELLALPVQTYRGTPLPLGEEVAMPIEPGRVLEVVDTDGGFVVETSNSIQYLTASETSIVIERETISLRSYPRSRRHRRATTATVDGGLLITALLDDHPLPTDQRRVWPPPQWW